MVSIYSVFPKNKIDINDSYTRTVVPIELEDISIRVGLSSENNFLTTLGVCNGQAQSITNKHLFYVPEILKGVSGHTYPRELFSTYTSILDTPEQEKEILSEPAFYFMDFDSVQGTVHSYDVLFHFLYYYTYFEMSCPLLIPKTDHHFANVLYTLLEKYYGVRFIRLELEKTYRCKSVFFVRSELHCLRSDVKEFLNTTLIEPILQQWKDVPVHKTVAKMKQSSKHSMIHKNAVFPPCERFQQFCSEKQIFLLDETLSEEEKIYYLNKASNVVVCWGSIYYIYINYYLLSTKDKHISVIFHKDMMNEREYLSYNEEENKYSQFSANLALDNVYNNTTWKGEIVDDIDTLELFVGKTVLKNL